MPSLHSLLYPDRDTVRATAIDEAQRQGVDPQLALSIFQLESGFRPLATSPQGARGVGQLIDTTAKSVGVTNPYDFRENIRGSIKYLAQLAGMFPNRPDLQAAAYQAGPGAVRRAGNRIPNTADINISTGEYARRVIAGVGGLLSPRSAEASPAARKPAQEGSLYDALYGRAQQGPEQQPQSMFEQIYPQSTQLPQEQYKSGFEFVGRLPENAKAEILKAMPDILLPATQEGVAQALRVAGEASQYQALPEDLTQPPTQLGIVLPSGQGAATVGAQIAGRAGGIVGASLGGLGARRAAQSVGLEAGDPTKILPQDVGDILALAAPPLAASVPAIRHGIQRLIPGRQTAINALREADTATAQAYGRAEAQYIDDVAAARAARQAQIDAQASPFTGAAEEGRRTITAAQRNTQLTEAAAADDAAQRAYEASQGAYQQAVQSQERAVSALNVLPQRYAPGTSSSNLFREIRTHLKDTPIDLVPTTETVAALRQELASAANPGAGASGLDRLLTKIEKIGNTGSATDIEEALRDITKLTAPSQGSTVRYLSAQLHDTLTDALRVSAPEAGELISAARGAYRTERALDTLRYALRRGGPVIARDEAGREVINVKAALNVLDRLAARDRFFQGSFQPEQLTAMQEEIAAAVKGTQRIPSLPSAPEPTTNLARLAGMRAGSESRPVLPVTEPIPDFVPPAPIEPSLSAPPQLGIALRDLIGGAVTGGAFGRPVQGLIIGGTVYGAQRLNHALAQGLLDPAKRQALRALANQQAGQVTPEQLAGVLGLRALTASEGARGEQVRKRLEELQ